MDLYTYQEMHSSILCTIMLQVHAALQHSAHSRVRHAAAGPPSMYCGRTKLDFAVYTSLDFAICTSLRLYAAILQTIALF